MEQLDQPQYKPTHDSEWLPWEYGFCPTIDECMKVEPGAPLFWSPGIGMENVRIVAFQWIDGREWVSGDSPAEVSGDGLTEFIITYYQDGNVLSSEKVRVKNENGCYAVPVNPPGDADRVGYSIKCDDPAVMCFEVFDASEPSESPQKIPFQEWLAKVRVAPKLAQYRRTGEAWTPFYSNPAPTLLDLVGVKEGNGLVWPMKLVPSQKKAENVYIDELRYPTGFTWKRGDTVEQIKAGWTGRENGEQGIKLSVTPAAPMTYDVQIEYLDKCGEVMGEKFVKMLFNDTSQSCPIDPPDGCDRVRVTPVGQAAIKITNAKISVEPTKNLDDEPQNGDRVEIGCIDGRIGFYGETKNSEMHYQDVGDPNSWPSGHLADAATYGTSWIRVEGIARKELEAKYPAKEKRPMVSITETRRIGKIKIRDIDNAADWHRIMGHLELIPIRAEHMLYSASIEITGISNLFEVVQRGEMTPEYQVILHRDDDGDIDEVTVERVG